SRHQRHRPDPLWAAAGARPVVSYVLFDLLFDRGQALWQETLLRRRARLRELLARADEPALVYSDGVVVGGRAFFAEVGAQGHEGVRAKPLSSRYAPGKRSAAWRKIKPAGMLRAWSSAIRPAGRGCSACWWPRCGRGCSATWGRFAPA